MTTKSRPIIMSSDSVRAILENRKTQTRRVMKPQPTIGKEGYYSDFSPYPDSTAYWYERAEIDKDGEMYPGKKVFGVSSEDGEEGHVCHFGAPGDRLWVREAWKIVTSIEKTWCSYKADFQEHTLAEMAQRCKNFGNGTGWKSPMFMPRKYSRLTLEITNVRCERVQEITTADIEQEGFVRLDTTGNSYVDIAGMQHMFSEFAEIWDKLNGKRKGCTWEDNPFTWVIEFKKIEGGDNE